jgi:hypothetical protein
MKINGLSSNLRSKTDMGYATKTALVLSPSPLQPSGGGLGGRISAAHRCWSGGPTTTQASRWKAKSRTGGAQAAYKDVKNEGRSGNVYENKGRCDKLPDTKDDISAWLHAILHRKTRILQKPSVFLSLCEHWGTNLSLQYLETR